MGTERIGMVQRKVAERFVAGNEMRMLKPPFDVVRLAGVSLVGSDEHRGPRARVDAAAVPALRARVCVFL